ncbi:hypothetical protein TNCV_2360801 [Trichonephila clavipes]|nr:hypothetical protein TNCV_2360801 [Trichonephila clavipes]
MEDMGKSIRKRRRKYTREGNNISPEKTLHDLLLFDSNLLLHTTEHEKMPRSGPGEALKTTRPELTHLRILWDPEQEEDHQQGGYRCC